MKRTYNFILALLLLAMFSNRSHATPITWIHAGTGNWSVATNWFPSQVPGPGDDVYIYSNTVTLDFNNSINSLTLNGGVLAGTNTLAVNSQFTWSGGYIENTGGITLYGTSSLNSTNYEGMTLLFNGLLLNAGQMTWSGSGTNLYVNHGGTLTNLASGTITIAADVSDDFSVGYGGVFGNAGLLIKTNSTGITTLNAPFVNTGTIQVQSGTLDLNEGDSFEPSFLAGGNLAMSAGGTLQLSGYNSVIAPTTAMGVGTLLVSAGTLQGASTLAVSNQFTWSGGVIENTGGITLYGTSTLNSTNYEGMALYINGLLRNAGQMTWSGSGTNLYVGYGGTLTNLASGTITIAADVSDDFSLGYGGVFGNAGLLVKTNTTGTTTLNAPFVNTGTVHVQSGSINLSGSYSLANSTLDFGISGPTNYGKINLSGAASFKSGLGVNLNGLYWPATNSSFNLLTYTSESGVLFTNAALPPFITWQTNYNATAFTLSVLARQTNAAPTNLTLSRAGNTNLNLAWPGDHTGWQLEAQTNSLQGTNWVIVPGSGLTNQMTLPIGPTNGAVFFRLVL